MAKKPAVAKKPGLDIKDEMLYSDYKVFDWLENQTPEMAKSFSPLVAMKWQSVVQDGRKSDIADYILNVNEIVNLGFWDLARHPDLQWRLMCAAGKGQAFKHGWIAMASGKKKLSKVDQVLLTLHPQLNNQEISLMKSKLTTETFKRLLLDMGKLDNEIKPLVDEFKKHHG